MKRFTFLIILLIAMGFQVFAETKILFRVQNLPELGGGHNTIDSQQVNNIFKAADVVKTINIKLWKHGDEYWDIKEFPSKNKKVEVFKNGFARILETNVGGGNFYYYFPMQEDMKEGGWYILLHVGEDFYLIRK